MVTLLAACSLVLVLALVLAVAMAACAYRRVNQHLQQHHPLVWASVEEPAAVEASASSPRSRFISQRRYLELRDPELVRLAETERRQAHIVLALVSLLALFAGCYGWLTAR